LAPLVEAQRERHLLRHRILQDSGGPASEIRFGAFTDKEAMLRRTIADRLGTATDDPRAQLLAGVVVTIMDVTYRQWIDGGATANLARLAGKTFDALAQLTGP
jgi:hypothetical protein